MSSSWQDERLVEVSRAELQLLLRLRSLEAGEHQVMVVKLERGRRGLCGWRVREGSVELPSPGPGYEQKPPDGAFRLSDGFSQREDDR